jgi:two-component system, response regulator
MEIAAEIILVEDNPSDADLIKRSLNKNNVANKILHLKDGQEVLQYLFGEGQWKGRTTANTPKVILLDLKMPKVSGIEVLKRIKSNQETMGIPVVILTSSKEDPDIKECYKLGVNSYVVKPVGFEDFSRTVAQLGLYWLLINQQPKW